MRLVPRATTEQDSTVSTVVGSADMAILGVSDEEALIEQSPVEETKLLEGEN